MNILKNSLILFGLAALSCMHATAAVRLTALQIVSVDANGKIPGVGAHRFRTTLHGGHPAIFLVKGEDRKGEIFNGPKTQNNEIDLPMTVGTHTYTIFCEKSNSYSFANYSIQFYFDVSRSAQISAVAPMNVTSPLFFPPFAVNKENVEDLGGYSVNSPNTLIYKSGRTEVTLTNFNFSSPTIYNEDRVSAFEVRKDSTLDYVGQFTLEVKAPPEISTGGTVNAASFTPKVAPGSLFSIFGTDLATGIENAAGLPLPTSLAGTSVTIGGKPAPLVYVSPGQINAQVPYEVFEAQSVPVVVTVHGTVSSPGNLNVVPAAPGIFQFGEKRAVVQNSDLSLNNIDNPAAVDSYVVAYLTGSGQLDNPVPTGGPAGANPLSKPRALVTASVNGVQAEVAFGGLTPDFVGLMQVNLKIPKLAPGSFPLVVTVGGEKSNAATITVK